MLNYKKPGFFVVAISIILCISVVICYLVETTHAGEGVYRQILFGRQNPEDSWEIINEGY